MQTLFENFTVTILKLNKLVRKIKLYEMEEFGLQAVHVMCVYYLNRSDGGLTCKQLVNLTYEDKAAISRALALLLKKGYVNYDGTKYNSAITLTDEGKKIAEVIADKADRAVEAGKDGNLTEKEREAFYATLNKISNNLKAYYDSLVENALNKNN